jgi:hypothetical protein
MNLLNELISAVGSGGLQDAGKKFGIDSSSVEKVLAQVMPALGQGIKKNAASSGGMDSLVNALKKGNHQQHLGDLSGAASASGIQDGNNILGHIFGSKDVSRNVAAQAASATGVSASTIKQMLPVIASMAMGMLSKKTDGGKQLAGGQGGLMGGLGSLLDSDGDGSVMDDLLGMAGKFMR